MQDNLAAYAPLLMYGDLIVVNAAASLLLVKCFRSVSLKDVLREKAPAAAAQVGAGAAAADPANPAPDTTSFARVSGMIGSIVLACFIWGLGNVVLFRAFADPDAIQKLLDGTTPFILSISALFAPYAVNKLNTIVRP